MRLISILTVAATLAACGQGGDQHFDSRAWKIQSDDRPIRTAMVDDLLRNQHLRGRTRAELVALLGEPTQTDQWTDWDMVYWLGPERSYIPSVDSEFLVLRLTDDRVTDVRVVRD